MFIQRSKKATTDPSGLLASRLTASFTEPVARTGLSSCGRPVGSRTACGVSVEGLSVSLVSAEVE